MSLSLFNTVDIIEIMENSIEKMRPPEDIRDKLDLNYRIENQSIILCEVRPKFNHSPSRQPKTSHHAPPLLHYSLPNFTLGTLAITDPQVSHQQPTTSSQAIPSPGDSITGMVFELTEQELQQADLYEVDYTRELVTLASGIQAWIYLPIV